MSRFKRVPAYLTVVIGVVFVFVLGTQTPREGRGPSKSKTERGDTTAAARAEPAYVFVVEPADSVMVDSGGNALAPARG